MKLLLGALLFLGFLSGVSLLFQGQGSYEKLSFQSHFGSEYTGAILRTEKGDIEIEFLPNNAPNTVRNFIELSRSDFYDGTRFHRVVRNFMVQGGDPTTKDETTKDLWGRGGPGYIFSDEISSLKYTRGMVAMANNGPDTNGSQFFIIVAPEAPWLSGKHTIFAKVVSGILVAESISKGAVVDNKNYLPKEPIILQDVVLK